MATPLKRSTTKTPVVPSGTAPSATVNGTTRLARNSPATFYDIQKDGITQGLLGTWMDCREKARLFLKGYSSKSTSMGLTFGTIVHACLDGVYSDIQHGRLKRVPTEEEVKTYVAKAEQAWRTEHYTADPHALQHLEMALLLSEQVLPVYFEYWKRDLREVQWTGLERSFALPYTLRDGRSTLLRGKLDGDFLRGKALWLFETKTKSHIEEEDLVDRLPFDLQVNFYLYALRKQKQQLPKGVWYNLIRRPGLRQGKAESLPDFATRCGEDVRARPEWYFSRLELAVTEQELDKWEGEFDDILRDFYDWWEGKSGHYKNSSMCETKYGRCEYLHLCAAKRMSYYTKRDKVFRELEDL